MPFPIRRQNDATLAGRPKDAVEPGREPFDHIGPSPSLIPSVGGRAPIKGWIEQHEIELAASDRREQVTLKDFDAPFQVVEQDVDASTADRLWVDVNADNVVTPTGRKDRTDAGTRADIERAETPTLPSPASGGG
jgi:hypothetical protein